MKRIFPRKPGLRIRQVCASRQSPHVKVSTRAFVGPPALGYGGGGLSMSTLGLIAARAPRNVRLRRGGIVVALALAYLFGLTIEAFAQRCQPRRRLPAIVLTTPGPCEF